MYIPIQEDVNKEEDFSNFFDSLLTKEQTFGEKVASDIDALSKAGQTRVMSKTTKAIIGVGVGAVVLFVGYKFMKKRKK